MRYLNYKSLIALAMKHYNEGGDFIAECWSENDYNAHVAEFGPLTKETALAIMGVSMDKWNDARAMERECYDPDVDEQETESENEIWDDDDFDFTSATGGDYSPSNPWDAPGMSVSDFI